MDLGSLFNILGEDEVEEGKRYADLNAKSAQEIVVIKMNILLIMLRFISSAFVIVDNNISDIEERNKFKSELFSIMISSVKDQVASEKFRIDDSKDKFSWYRDGWVPCLGWIFCVIVLVPVSMVIFGYISSIFGYDTSELRKMLSVFPGLGFGSEASK